MAPTNSIHPSSGPLQPLGPTARVVDVLPAPGDGNGSGRLGDVGGFEGCDTGKAGSQSVILPWPPKDLSPNARIHWAALSKAKRSYRAACAWQAKAQGLRRTGADALHLTLTFHAPTRRAYDLDNALARMKSGLDGLSDVLGVDDSKWTLTIKKAAIVGGFVRVEVAEC